MKILIASDFYYEYELIETNDPQNAVKYIRSDFQNAENVTVLGFHDTISKKNAIKQADLILFITDFIE